MYDGSMKSSSQSFATGSFVPDTSTCSIIASGAPAGKDFGQFSFLLRGTFGISAPWSFSLVHLSLPLQAKIFSRPTDCVSSVCATTLGTQKLRVGGCWFRYVTTTAWTPSLYPKSATRDDKTSRRYNSEAASYYLVQFSKHLGPIVVCFVHLLVSSLPFL